MILNNFHTSHLITILAILFGAVGVGFAFIGENNLALALFIVSALAGFFTKRFRQLYKPDEGQLTLGLELEKISKVIVYGLLPFVYLVQVTAGSIIGLIVASLYLLTVSIRISHYSRPSRFLKETKDGFSEGIDLYYSVILIPLISLLGYLVPAGVFGIIMIIVYVLLGAGYLLPVEIPKMPSSWFLYVFIVEVIALVILLIAGPIG